MEQNDQKVFEYNEGWWTCAWKPFKLCLFCNNGRQFAPNLANVHCMLNKTDFPMGRGYLNPMHCMSKEKNVTSFDNLCFSAPSWSTQIIKRLKQAKRAIKKKKKTNQGRRCECSLEHTCKPVKNHRKQPRVQHRRAGQGKCCNYWCNIQNIDITFPT